MSTKKIKAAIVGPGNIGIDLMFKLLNSSYIEVDTMVGVVKESKGLQLAREKGIKATSDGVKEILGNKEIELVFEATSAKAHLANAPLYKEDGKIAIDLTPAMIGPFVVPAVNIEQNLDTDNVNMVTCGGQATIPMVAAINSVQPVEYAEIVATISSRSAGPGTRQNIDEFTETTSKAICEVGGAKKGKAIIVLNPAEPPIIMRDTVYVKVKDPNEEEITKAVKQMEQKVQEYVPGYRVKAGPLFDGDKVTVMLEVEGAGMYLPKYSGNLDIMTAAAKAVGEKIAYKLLKERGEV
ncbi:acetaldehyde dehydrogenase (acetylating) [Petroclostridium sp. X23]|uniref:acetaldehyde dehydrogenase (acetylating) n=1 Tax=Petroclostridium sp. X23 TaxID=3045146 RepID=UPI0024ADBAEE|nr:acetaldehyde dehydrogenase (acetylating) [Petroclostridium sp. X23]WHH59274.1 acetaldehyde dehydrogenase (acetylating) [Petroclostridium sp. X23]